MFVFFLFLYLLLFVWSVVREWRRAVWKGCILSGGRDEVVSGMMGKEALGVVAPSVAE